MQQLTLDLSGDQVASSQPRARVGPTDINSSASVNVNRNEQRFPSTIPDFWRLAHSNFNYLGTFLRLALSYLLQ
jgi:hypothetical protein